MVKAFRVATPFVCATFLALVCFAGQATAAKLPGKSDFAGYIAPLSVAPASVISAEFVVPQITCVSQTDDEVLWVDVEIDNNTAQYPTAGIFGVCTRGLISFEADADGVPAAPPVVIHPGDKLKVIAECYPAANDSRGIVKDLTTGAQGSRKIAAAQQMDPTSAAIYVGSDTPPTSEPDFGTIEWTHVEVDGEPIGSTNPQGYDMIRNHPNHMLVWTSPLNQAGDSFQNVWLRGN
jgi:Peptidase A4 family